MPTNNKSVSLAEALGVAEAHWHGRPGSRTMASLARKCVTIIGPLHDCATLTAADAVSLLARLRGLEGLSPKSVQCAYGAFKRVLELAGCNTKAWPRAPTPPRKTRDALTRDDLRDVIGWLDQAGQSQTADLARLLRGTGLRVRVEALSRDALRFDQGAAYDVLHVVGKGGHERLIPVVDAEARNLLRDHLRLDRIRRRAYADHLRWWRKSVAACGVTSRLPTPHAARHYYACQALEKSGGNLELVRELMGHRSPSSTAAYLEVSLQRKAEAL